MSGVKHKKNITALGPCAHRLTAFYKLHVLCNGHIRHEIRLTEKCLPISAHMIGLQVGTQ